MSNYAIIKTGGKQVKVEEGSVIYVEKLNVEAGQTVTFDEVIFVGGETTKVGAPLVEGATVDMIGCFTASSAKDMVITPVVLTVK